MGNIVSQRRSTITHEQENFTRFGKAIVGIGTQVLQEILETYIAPKDIALKVTSVSHPNLWRRLNAQQRLLIGQAATDGYKDFDITLCYTLLRNLNVGASAPFSAPFPKPTSGWGKQPLATDSTQSDDIERIRILRNEMYGHLARPYIPIKQFSIIWNQLRDLCARLKNNNPSGTDFLKKLKSLESCKVTRVQWNNLLDLIKQSREHEKAIEDHSKRIESLENHQSIIDHNLQTVQAQHTAVENKAHCHDTQIAALDTIVLGHGTTIDEHGTQLEEYGRDLATLNTEANRHGAQIDEHGAQIHEHGAKIEEHGAQIHEHGAKIEEHGAQIHKHGAKIEEHGAQIDEYGAQIYEHGTQIDEHGAKIEEHGAQIHEHGAKIEEHGAQIDEHGAQIHEHGAKIEEHGAKIEEHGAKIDEHGAQIDKHGAQIDEHGGQLGTLASQSQNQQAQIVNIKKQLKSDKQKPADESELRGLKQRLIKINTDITKAITISPLQERGKAELPIELLFAQVVIREDHTYREKGENYAEYIRKVTDPDDIFMMNGEEVRKVYLLGDAAHGKTTYCIWLVRKWCNAQGRDNKGSKELDKWEKALQRFDYVFLLQFRHASPDLASVIDMICQDMFADDEDYWDTIRYVLSSNKYRSLIIMDGLDEWNPNEGARGQLTCQGMPNFHMSSTVSCFYSMRPWVFSFISKLVKVSDRVLEIHGLSDEGMEQVVENVLLNYYELKDERPKFELTYTRIMQNLCKYSLKSFMQIPLLAVVCVQILYKGSEIGNSMSSFYAAMLSMLIERAYQKHDIETEQENPKIKKDNRLPEILSQHECIQNWISVLSKLGKVAYEGLISNETNLVFQKRKLEKEIGERDLQFALDVGLISQKEAPSLLTKNVSLHFFHKSLQEFLAVIYIVTNKEAGDSFCKYLSNVKVIMELSNVIMFICGICPSLGSVISQRVVSVTDSDTEICEYRESPERNKTVEELYKLQGSWYRELQDRQLDNPVTFHISDVYCWLKCDMETVRVTKELLSDQLVDIRSLNLQYAPIDIERGVTNTQLNDFLCNRYNNTRSLEMVYIYCCSGRMCVHPLCIPSLKCLHLSSVKTNCTHLDGNVCHPLLSNMPLLRVLKIQGVTLGDRGLDLSNIISLRVLVVDDVTLSDRGLDLSDMTSLQVLKLRLINLHSKGLNLSCMPSLQVLELSNIKLGERGLDLSNLTSLQELKLLYMDLGDIRQDLSSMTSLRELQSSSMKLGNRGPYPYDMTSLRELRSSSMRLGNRGPYPYDMTSQRELRSSSMRLGNRGPYPYDMTSQRELGLSSITLGHRRLDLSADMEHIWKASSVGANMSLQWRQFILSLLNIQHRFNVKIIDSNIDDESRTMIRSSPEFNITKDGNVWHMLRGKSYHLYFTRVWTQSNVTHDDAGKEILYKRFQTQSNKTTFM